MRVTSVPARVLAAIITAIVPLLLPTTPVVTGSSPKAGIHLQVGSTGEGSAPTPHRRPSVNVRTLGARGATKATSPSSASPFRARPTQATTLLVGPPSAVEATLTANPAAAQPGFQGFAATSGPSTNRDPPDPWVAVGPDDVVQVVNTSLRITDRTGASMMADVALTDFFGINGLVPTFNSDPRVIYDSLHDRWIATEVEWDCDTSGGVAFGHGYIGLRVSQTSDPTGTWNGFSFQFNDQLPDYPGVGTSTDKVAFPSDLFNLVGGGDCAATSSYAGVGIVVVDWTAVLGTSTLPSDFYVGGTKYHTPRVAVQAPATSAPLRVVSQLDAAGSQDVDFLTISGLVGPTGGGTTLTEVDLTAANLIQPFLDPILPRQPGGTVTAQIDSRPTDAIWQNNKLTFVSTQACTPAGDSGPRDCVRVSQLNTATATPGVAQDFLVAQSGEDSYYGGVGVGGNGTTFVVWTRSSATAGDFPSSYAAYHLPTDPANTISPPELLAAGAANHLDGRWGDYVGVAQDPQDPNSAWQGNEYASSDGHWATFVSQLMVGSGGTYVPIAPARVLDTRFGNGLSGPFMANVPRTFSVAGHGGVPASAVAVTGNLTVTGQTAAGFVSLTVSPTADPSTSTLNFPVADDRANNGTILLSPAGTLSAVYKAASGKSAQLIFDVTGYFLNDDSGATYTPVSPARILDSRASLQVGPYATPFAANVPRQVPVWTHGGIPATATAVTGNLTVTGQTAAGYLTLSNLNTSNPATSTLNFPLGDTRANGVSVALTGTGSLWAVYKAPAGKTANVIFDVTGYYVPGTSGLHFFPLNPGRALDGRPAFNIGLPGVFNANVSRTLDVDGHLGVPVGAAAITGNLTVTGQTQAGYAAMTPNPDNNPSTSTLNFPLGDTRANGVTVRLNGSGFTSLVYKASSAATYLILDVTGYFR